MGSHGVIRIIDLKGDDKMIKEYFQSIWEKIINYKVKFRDSNDKTHFFGAYYLTLVLGVICTTAFNIDRNIFVNIFYSFLLGALVTNLLGLIYRIAEWKVLPIYNAPFFKRHPKLVFLSGDNILNPYKLWLNFLGSTIIVPFFLMIKHIFVPSIDTF
jgi:hypothetical protein